MVDAEGWRKKNGSKWVTMGELMFIYRAAAFWTRIFAPELSLGMHTSDEVEDIQVVHVTRDPNAAPATRPRVLDIVAGTGKEPTPTDESAMAAAVDGDEQPRGSI